MRAARWWPLIGSLLLLSGILRAETVNVGILVYSGVYNTEFVAPYDVFEHVNAYGHRVKVFLVTPDQEPVISAEGLRVETDYTFASHPEIHVLIVPSFENYESDIQRLAPVTKWLRQVSDRARYVLSNCWGAFYLAKAGLLEGRYAMTYPPDIVKLGRQFPGIKVVQGHRFVRDGKFITGGGGVASYENALYVVAELWGETVAKQVASGLVMEWDPQKVKYFIARKVRTPGDLR